MPILGELQLSFDTRTRFMRTLPWFRSSFSRHYSNSRSIDRARRRAFVERRSTLAFETLQDRAMLSVTAIMSGTILSVTADNSGNSIAITSAQSGGNTYVKVNGNDVGLGTLASTVTFITVTGGSGSDT